MVYMSSKLHTACVLSNHDKKTNCENMTRESEHTNLFFNSSFMEKN